MLGTELVVFLWFQILVLMMILTNQISQKDIDNHWQLLVFVCFVSLIFIFIQKKIFFLHLVNVFNLSIATDFCRFWLLYFLQIVLFNRLKCHVWKYLNLFKIPTCIFICIYKKYSIPSPISKIKWWWKWEHLM